MGKPQEGDGSIVRQGAGGYKRLKGGVHPQLGHWVDLATGLLVERIHVQRPDNHHYHDHHCRLGGERVGGSLSANRPPSLFTPPATAGFFGPAAALTPLLPGDPHECFAF